MRLDKDLQQVYAFTEELIDALRGGLPEHYARAISLLGEPGVQLIPFWNGIDRANEKIMKLHEGNQETWIRFMFAMPDFFEQIREVSPFAGCKISLVSNTRCGTIWVGGDQEPYEHKRLPTFFLERFALIMDEDGMIEYMPVGQEMVSTDALRGMEAKGIDICHGIPVECPVAVAS